TFVIYLTGLLSLLESLKFSLDLLEPLLETGLQSQILGGAIGQRVDPRLLLPHLVLEAFAPIRKNRVANFQCLDLSAMSTLPLPESLDPPPPLLDSQGEHRWVVESIVDHEDRPTRRHGKKRLNHQRFYRVRWRGYPPSSDTWEPRQTLESDVPDVVRSYENRL
uniref:Chromo domain-containing protein n=1 Tax=Globisporangium ultimum (strain ATCC 200006 / CBS 805.95 / DAOM BR144) TaxID=431595 RepID=K3WP04_GLOUD